MNVRIEKRGVVAVLTLDRVAMRNAFDRPTVALLTSACNDVAVARAVANCLAGGPKAQAAAKPLIADSARPIKAALIEVTAGRSAAVRTTPEAAAGLATFPAKRKLGRVPE